jgi:hypothetical protein
LHRSASTRAPSTRVGVSLPPVPPNTVDAAGPQNASQNTNNHQQHRLARMSSASSAAETSGYFSATTSSSPGNAPSNASASINASAAQSSAQQMQPSASPNASKLSFKDKNNGAQQKNASMSLAAKRQSTATVQLPPPAILQTPSSAPQSPRCSVQNGASGKLLNGGGSVYVPHRKFSDACETSAAAASAISRNGSMAFLLEQQHILRREFNTPDSAVAAYSNATASTTTRSNSSSLSPSIEQLNCAGGSRSGSDVDEGMTATASIACMDARVLGLDPALYGSAGGGGTTTATTCSLSSASSYSVPDSAQGGGGAPPSSPAAANSGSGGAVSASSSWQQQQSTSESTNEPRPRGLGLIYCTLQHFPVRKRLRVSVLKIEGLAGELKPELEIQPFCKVNILPGTKQKQLSVVKRGRDAVFNQEFFFDGIATEDLESKMLSIEVFHQSATKLQKDSEIGEMFVPLKDLTQLSSKKEVRIVEELKYSVSSKKLGKIHLTTSIEKEARRLTINLIKVDDLPKWGIIGAPDVCVRITMSQGASAPQTKSSRILKSTTNAVYKEAVMFLISTKPSDLQHTRITISVHDLSRTVTGDDVIGSVYLGELAVDKSEIEQWKNTTANIGKEYKASHHLKLRNRQNAPDVHVSETHSDGEENNNGDCA